MSRVIVAAVAAALAVAAPSRELQSQRVLTVIARDTALESPPTVPAGLVTVRLLLTGKARRELVVHRIPAGMTPEELVRGAAGRPTRFFEEWSFGGPAVPRDSANDASVTMELRPGRYALVSYEVDATGRPRTDRYKWLMLTAIRTSALIPTRFAVPDVTVKIKDARIDIVGAVRRGQRTLHIENMGAQPHDLMVVRLNSGKTVDDVQHWLRDRRGSPPFFYVGGMTPLSRGGTAQTRLVLQTGTHVVLSTMNGDYQRGVIALLKVS